VGWGGPNLPSGEGRDEIESKIWGVKQPLGAQIDSSTENVVRGLEVSRRPYGCSLGKTPTRTYIKRTGEHRGTLQSKVRKEPI